MGEREGECPFLGRLSNHKKLMLGGGGGMPLKTTR